ncbi:hypothetical protein HELRODRAFT_62766 [Helobdella robusta]|uniref:Cyanocobalamin reductase (cyanide-eliminating) n=1 Tax=Helobdella robusta TaxID=6412 RepID=T1FX49_HELRO|nr:hypothetical protein HELRODRAFT_62766 [Helobdella robusta]ESO12903.1 hypothetical protein HELRODRAFT_62766 [Helobdella robusta]
MTELLGDISTKLHGLTLPIGLEAYPFKIGWYNDEVHKSFHLEYDYDTLAFSLVSLPKMFDILFCPFLEQWDGKGGNDALDECMRFYLNKLKSNFTDVELIHDFEFHHSKRPKVLVQTAGHVSGGVFYFQRKDIKHSDPWPENRKICGVCLHPKYGGWFGLRGILIFKNVKVPNLMKKELECFLSNEQIISLLDKFNNSWRDGTFRDVIEPLERYSTLQQKYFNVTPDERLELIEKMKYGTPV